MDREAHRSFERITDAEEKIRGVEVAVKSIVRLRLILAEHQSRLALEKASKVVNMEVVRRVTAAIKDIERELEDTCAFLEEFDPVLFQKLKDNS